MVNTSERLDPSTLARLRKAVLAAQASRGSIPHSEILAVHAAAPADASLTIDLEATEQLGMPLLVVQVPVGPRPSLVLSSLTPREFEVVGLLAAGWSNQEIATRLGIATSTVKEHVHRALAKTELPNRAALAHAYVGGAEGSKSMPPKLRAGDLPSHPPFGGRLAPER